MALGDASASIDPISLEVIRRGVIAATNQIDANITRTAFSPFIYEYKDYAVGLLDAQGQLVAQNSGGMPIFVADSVGMAVRAGLEVYGADHLRHGDVVVCNDPVVQGQHLNNVVMYTPIRVGPDGESLFRHQHALDRSWRLRAALHGCLHGGAATPYREALERGAAQ